MTCPNLTFSTVRNELTTCPFGAIDANRMWQCGRVARGPRLGGLWPCQEFFWVGQGTREKVIEANRSTLLFRNGFSTEATESTVCGVSP